MCTIVSMKSSINIEAGLGEQVMSPRTVSSAQPVAVKDGVLDNSSLVSKHSEDCSTGGVNGTAPHSLKLICSRYLAGLNCEDPGCHRAFSHGEDEL